MPGAEAKKFPEMAVGGGPPPSGRGPLSKTTGPAQVTSSGPKTVKVTVPVAAGAVSGALKTVAVSERGNPSRVTSVARVATMASGWLTLEVSPGSLQLPEAGA